MIQLTVNCRVEDQWSNSVLKAVQVKDAEGSIASLVLDSAHHWAILQQALKELSWSSESEKNPQQIQTALGDVTLVAFGIIIVRAYNGYIK